MTINEAQRRVAAARAGGKAAVLADALVALAGPLVPGGRFADARAALDEAAAIHERLKQIDDERHCRQFSATLSRFLSDLEGARSRASRAAALSPDGSPGAVSAAAELGEIALTAGDAAAAAAAFGDALRHAAGLGLKPPEMSGLLRKRAAPLAAIGDTAAAVMALDEAAALLESCGDSSNALRAGIEAVTALQNAGQIIDANERRTRLFVRANELGDDHALADLELLESAAALDRRDPLAALGAARRARDHALRANAPVSYVAAAVAIAELRDQLGDRLGAYGALAAGYVTLDDLLGAETGREAFAPRLRALRQKWGAEEFQRIKSAYEAQRQQTAPGHE